MNPSDECITRFRELLKKSKKIVFFGGAGVSTASGIPDFRSPQGLYNQKTQKEKPWAGYAAEELLSHSFFMEKTEWFYEYYREAILHPEALPNACHQTLSKWERQGRLLGVITQNIDGLHQMAGSQNVTELHGTIWRNHCMKCGKAYSLEDVPAKDTVPTCSCGGTIKPDVTLYEEQLPAGAMERAVHWIRQADLFIVGGTSLAVYPAAGLVRYNDAPLVLVNIGQTSMDAWADLKIAEDIAQVFAEVQDIFDEDEHGDFLQ